MKIETAIKKYSKGKPHQYCYIPTDDLGYWNVNVQFVNGKQEDETQFDLLPSEFDYGSGKSPALIELWKEFCKENNLPEESVTSINIVGAW